METLSHTKSNQILQLINPPTGAGSFKEMNDLLNGNHCLTLIEKPFFNHITAIVEQLCKADVEGDIVLVGVFKGGSALYLKALFEEFGCFRKWWLFDSFKGFDNPTIQHPNDKKSLEIFSSQLNFQYPTPQSVYRLFEEHNLHHNLNVIEGFVENTLPAVEIPRVSFLHIDVDFYEPTSYCLQNLYPRLSKNGWVIIDDYNVTMFDCKQAVTQFRQQQNIQEPIVELGGYPAGWQKTN
jgi:O-methyltransferase